jgi:hypothetical protein
MKLYIPLIALLAFTSIAAEPIATNSSRRYKIVAAPQGDYEPTVFKIDTWTGQTWLYVRYSGGPSLVAKRRFLGSITFWRDDNLATNPLLGACHAGDVSGPNDME